MRPALVLAAVLCLLLGAGTSSARGAATLCTASEKAHYQAAARAYAKRIPKDRVNYFKAHQNRRLRTKFVKQQQARLKALRSRAACELIVLNPPPTANETFVFGPGMAAESEALIQSDIAFAAQDENRLVGLSLEKLTVFATTDADWLGSQQCAWYGRGGSCAHDVAAFYASGNSAAQGGPGAVFIYWAASSWGDGPTHSQTIIAHEVFHVLQYQTDHLIHAPETPPDQIRPSGPVWLDEGAPELVGLRVTADRRLDTYVAALQSQIAVAKQITQPLDQLERLSQTNIPRVYSLFAVSVDHLTKIPVDGLSALADYYRALGAGATWPAAFSEAFGMSLSDYYANFAGYRAKL